MQLGRFRWHKLPHVVFLWFQPCLQLNIGFYLQVFGLTCTTWFEQLVCHKHVACNKGVVSKTAIAINHLIDSLVSTATAEKKTSLCIATPPFGERVWLHVNQKKTDLSSPANSDGFTMRLTVWGINSRSHDLASKSHSESENLEIAKQFR